MRAATAAVGLLAGIVTGVYVLGGTVIALRLFFEGFEPGSVAAIIGQLPRELVVTTALLDVGLAAVFTGLLAVLAAAVYAAVRGTAPADSDNGLGTAGLLVVVTALLLVPAIVAAILTHGWTWWLLTGVFGFALAYLVVFACWREAKRAGGRTWPPALRIAAIGGLGALVAVIPAVMFAAALDFEGAQVCTTTSLSPEKGELIGEGGGSVLLEIDFSHEESIVSLPSDEVTRSEYGDLSSTFTCPPPPGAKAAAKLAAVALGHHGSTAERELAVRLRPRLRFDSDERWRPLEVGAFLRERFPGTGAHLVCDSSSRPTCSAASGPVDLRRRRGPDYLDIEGNALDGDDFASPYPECHRRVAVDCNGGPRSAIYYRRTSHAGRWYWDYWWFFRYNDYRGPYNRCEHFCGDHEGDWEGVTVVTTAALKPEIVAVIYAAHRVRVLAEAAVAPFAGGHPLVFIAEGTHASYPFRCARACGQYSSLVGFTLPEDPHDGAMAWGGNRDKECGITRCVRPLPEVGDPGEAALPLAGAWAGWPGSWGETCHQGCHERFRKRESSPRSPGLQTRFKCPWAATRWAKPAPDGSGLSKSDDAGDSERLLAACAAQRGGL
jgi:hypothetical protein